MEPKFMYTLVSQTLINLQSSELTPDNRTSGKSYFQVHLFNAPEDAFCCSQHTLAAPIAFRWDIYNRRTVC